jgi:KaiC/GvpD/RAD55 family RecA-like ATPase
MSDHDAQSLPPAISRLSDVKPERVDWLLPAYIPLGFPTIIAGRPGEGKSLFTIYLAARVSSGSKWGFIEGRAPLGDTVIISAEDSPEHVIRPRFDALESADDKRVLVLRGVPAHDDMGAPCLNEWAVDNVSFLRRELDKLPAPALLVVDPVSAYMTGGGNVGVRRALAPLVRLAEDYQIAVVFVSHLRKNEDGDAGLQDIIDSTAYGALPRSALIFGRSVLDPSKGVITLAKHNLGPEAPPLLYRVESFQHRVGEHARLIVEGVSDMEVTRPCLPVRREVQTWLRQQLEPNGAVISKYIFEEGEDRGFTKDQMRRALKDIGARHRKVGFGESSMSLWELPELVRKREEERPLRLACIKAVFKLYRQGIQPRKLSKIVREVERVLPNVPRRDLRAIVSRIVKNVMYRRVDDEGRVVYTPEPTVGCTLAGRPVSLRELREFETIAKQAEKDIATGLIRVRGTHKKSANVARFENV